MQAKRKLTALLLSLCMVLGVLPMTAFAAGAPAAPGDLKREWTNSGLKVSWSQPEPIGELEIFEYEVSLFVDENLKEKETVRQATDYTFKTFGDLTEPTNFRVEVKAREAISGTGDRGNPASFDVTEWTEWSSASKETFVEDDSPKVNTEIIKHYTGVVDVALPGSDQKLYKEGIEAADDADIEAIMDLLYAYFNHAPTYKQLAEAGQATTHELRIPVIYSSDSALTLQIRENGYALRTELLDLKSRVESLHAITRATWALSAAVGENGTVTLPASLAYEVGSKSLRLYYLGLLLAPDEQYEEVGSSGESSHSVKLLFAADKGDEFQLIIKK